MEMIDGQRITSLEELSQAAKEKRSVQCKGFYGDMHKQPAAFCLNMTGSVLLSMFRNGLTVAPKPIKRNVFGPKTEP